MQAVPGFVASRLEAGEGPSYTVDTVKRVRKDLDQKDRLFFLVGGDAFDELETWKGWQELVRLTEFIVVSRPDSEYRIPEGARVHQAGWASAACIELDDPNSTGDGRGDTGASGRSTRVYREARALQFRGHAELIESLGQKLSDARRVARFNLKAMQREYRFSIAE